AVRQVKGQYGIRKADGSLARVRSAVLVFDSSRLPAAAGVRAATATASRQLLYRLGNRLVKLRLETAGVPQHLSLVGQIVDEADPGRTLPGLPVRVLSGRKTVTGTVTNRLGEFELELEPARGLAQTVGHGTGHGFTTT